MSALEHTLEPEPRSPGQGRALGAGVLAIAALLAVAPRAMQACTDHGIFWPDEIFQSLEPAHRLVFGYGLQAWEFRDGARSWLFPGLLAGLFHTAEGLGLRQPLHFVVLARLFMVGLGAVGVYASVRLAQERGGIRALVLALGLHATLPLALVFGHRTLTEGVSGSLLAAAALGLHAPRAPRPWSAGMLAGLAVGLRIQTLALALFLLLGLGWSTGRGPLFRALGAFAGVFLAVGLVDWPTWGAPFASLLNYLKFNLVQNGAALFGTEGPGYYGRTLVSSTGPAVWLLGLGFLAGAGRLRILALGCVGHLVLHSLIAHKEIRFLLPAIPLGMAVVSVGLGRLAEIRLPRTWQVPALASILGLAAVLLVQHGRNLTYADLGAYVGTGRATRSVWRTGENLPRILAEAGQRPDLCGLALWNLSPFLSGGYTYLHREVPLLFGTSTSGPWQETANYLVVPAASTLALPPGLPYQPVLQRGAVALYRRPGGCPRPGPATVELPGASQRGLADPDKEHEQAETPAERTPATRITISTPRV